jgi:hypothetical protein
MALSFDYSLKNYFLQISAGDYPIVAGVSLASCRKNFIARRRQNIASFLSFLFTHHYSFLQQQQQQAHFSPLLTAFFLRRQTPFAIAAKRAGKIRGKH